MPFIIFISLLCSRAFLGLGRHYSFVLFVSFSFALDAYVRACVRVCKCMHIFTYIIFVILIYLLRAKCASHIKCIIWINHFNERIRFEVETKTKPTTTATTKKCETNCTAYSNEPKMNEWMNECINEQTGKTNSVQMIWRKSYADCYLRHL